jgi:hypothetical protein
MTTALLPFTPPRAKRSLMMWRWLLGGRGGAWSFLEKRDLRDVWHEHAEAILAHHVKRRPGTRPARWWQFDAPEPRRRLGGTGTPLHECSAYVAPFTYGIPTAWRTHGDFFTSGTPIDPEDPPAFESEAAYLLRLNLLLPDELARLLPEDFDPEEID